MFPEAKTSDTEQPTSTPYSINSSILRVQRWSEVPKNQNQILHDAPRNWEMRSLMSISLINRPNNIVRSCGSQQHQMWAVLSVRVYLFGSSVVCRLQRSQFAHCRTFQFYSRFIFIPRTFFKMSRHSRTHPLPIIIIIKTINGAKLCTNRCIAIIRCTPHETNLRTDDFSRFACDCGARFILLSGACAHSHGQNTPSLWFLFIQSRAR